MGQLLWKTVCRFFKNSKLDLPWDPAIPPLGLKELPAHPCPSLHGSQ